MGNETTMKKTPIIKIKPTKNILIRDKFTDTDKDGVPNYRDCNILNPHKQDDISQHIAKLKGWAYGGKPVKHKALYDYLKSTLASGVTIGCEIHKFTEKEVSETLAYLNQKENIMISGREENGNMVLFLTEHFRRRGRPLTVPKNYPPTKAEESERKRRDQYSMKRDTLALQMYNKHYVSLTAQQKRNVTREFRRMM